jgi:predicted Zn-dependent protease
MLAMQGRLDDALVQNQRAAELDPFGGLVVMDMVVTLAWQGKYEAAKELSHRALDLDPTDSYVQWASAWTDIEAGKFSEAISELQKYIAAMKDYTWFAAWLGYAYGCRAIAPEPWQFLRT